MGKNNLLYTLLRRDNKRKKKPTKIGLHYVEIQWKKIGVINNGIDLL